MFKLGTTKIISAYTFTTTKWVSSSGNVDSFLYRCVQYVRDVIMAKYNAKEVKQKTCNVTISVNSQYLK